MSSTKELVFVTGVSGFTGAHVVDRLIKEGYRVRGSVRAPKVTSVQTDYDAAYGKDRVEIVGGDLTGDFTDAVIGVDAVIHVASPLIGRVDNATTLDTALEGTMNVVRQAYDSGVKKFAVLSSVGAAIDILDPKPKITEEDWNTATREGVIDESPFVVYAASKALAEKALWDFAEQHADIQVTTLLPSMFTGPPAPGQRITPGDSNALSTNLTTYNLLLPNTKFQTPPFGFVDVRDVAQSLVSAVKVPGKNRVLLSGEWYDVTEAVDYIASVRPELKGRLASLEPTGQSEPMIDGARAVKILGLPGIRKWKDTVIETVDYLIALEKEWIRLGIDVDEKLKKNEWNTVIV